MQPARCGSKRLLLSRTRAAASGAAGVPPPQRFLLARHGQTSFNAEKRFQGILDEETQLTEKGREQARVLGAWVCDGAGPIGSVYVSPLMRARQTLDEARTVAGGLPEEQVIPELREIELYEWQGRTQQEVQASDPELMRLWKKEAWNLRLGGGRPVVQDVWDRAADAWRIMRSTAPSGDAASLIVAHGTLGKALLATALDLPAQAFRHFAMKNGEVVEVQWPAGEEGCAGVRWCKRHPEPGAWRLQAEEARAFSEGFVVQSSEVAV